MRVILQSQRNERTALIPPPIRLFKLFKPFQFSRALFRRVNRSSCSNVILLPRLKQDIGNWSQIPELDLTRR